MATVNIGSLKFNWKGAYNGSTAYAVDDVTEYNGSSYICILASTGNLPTNTTYFQPMATKGTDGTDVGTTITTQGDILYRDGSGLQRLAAGTASQVLQTGGAGANPSWTTMSSDMVKIGSTDITSSTASVIFQHGTNGVVIDNTYRTYMLRCSGFQPTAQGENVRMRVGVGGSMRSSGYITEAHRSYYSGGTDRGNDSSNIINFRGGSEDSVHGEINCVINFSDMADATTKTSAVGLGALFDGNDSSTSQANQGTCGGIYGTAEANDTIQIYMGSGNIAKGQFTLYGFK